VKVRSLAKIQRDQSGATRVTLFRPCYSLIRVFDQTQEALDSARLECAKHIESEGRQWVEFWKKPDERVNCPEGFIKLPGDIWCCKLTGQICMLQSSIDPNDMENFTAGCHLADAHKKAQVFNAVSTGKYDGFHHVPGRYLCVACEEAGEKKESFWYHYPWEFAELDVALGLSYEQCLALLTILSLPRVYVSCPLCAECCKRIATDLRPDFESSLQLFEFDVGFRK
jgi:hypothetical protein